MKKVGEKQLFLVDLFRNVPPLLRTLALSQWLILSALIPFLLGNEEENKVRITLQGTTSWMDTSLDVEEAQEIHFKASGMISLQKGNPLAFCGPEGFNLKTMQQPLPEQNIGALIGKVVQVISVEIEEETGKEIRQELVRLFFIGVERVLRAPIRGRLFIGINENIVGDNSGEFKVEIILKKKGEEED